MDNITTIIFDLDNTLINRQKAAYERMKYFIREIEEFKDLDEMEIESIAQHFVLIDENGSCNKTYMFARIKELYGLKINAEELGKRWNQDNATITYVYDDALETLTYLKEKGYKLAIITNGDAYLQYQKAVNSGLSHLMDEIIVAGKYKISKPDKRIYEVALEKLGSKPEECVFVGDTFHTDIIGAYRANIKPIWFVSDNLKQCDVDIIKIKSLSDLKKIL